MSPPQFVLKERREVPSDPISNPNIPAGTRFVQLAPITLVPFLPITNILVLPGLLDIGRLERAIGALAAIWPDIAGRYVTRQPEGEQWSDYAIHLSQSPIPLDIGQVYVEGDHPFSSRAVVQEAVAPYNATLAPNFEFPDSGETLTAIRLTTVQPANVSVLGITISHLLADAAGACKIINHLSQLYIDPECTIPDPPIFFAKVTFPAWPPATETLKKHYTALAEPISIEAATLSFINNAKKFDAVRVTLTAGDIKALRAETQNTSGGYLSDHDALSAWWVYLLERAGEEPFDRIRYTINYRTLWKDTPGFPNELKDQFNTTVQVREFSISSPDSPKRPSRIARDIRNAIDELRADPVIGAEWLSMWAHWFVVAAREVKLQDWIPPKGVAMVNSNLRYDWTPSFGFDAGTSYHTATSILHCLRVFRSNPEAKGEKAKDTVELGFRVSRGHAAKIHQLVAQDQKRWRKM